MTDFFINHFGLAGRSAPDSLRARVRDALADVRLAGSREFRRILSEDRQRPPARVLVVGVEVPSRAGQLQAIADRLAKSRHEVDRSLVRMQPQGKFANVDDAIAAAPRPLADYDWLVITDDDVGLRAEGFLDRYLALANAADLAISQPAHRFASYTSFALTRRDPRALARTTRFVEIGPLTVLRADTFAELVPFPPSRWCFGIDVLWSEIATRNGWRMGVVDGAPVGHLKPVAGSYDARAAFEEGSEMLRRFGVTSSREELLSGASVALGL